MTTREQIIAAAKEAGAMQLMSPTKYENLGLMGVESIERFYTLVANQTKDRCAAVCYANNWLIHGSEMAMLIEAMKEPE